MKEREFVMRPNRGCRLLAYSHYTWAALVFVLAIFAVARAQHLRANAIFYSDAVIVGSGMRFDLSRVRLTIWLLSAGAAALTAIAAMSFFSGRRLAVQRVTLLSSVVACLNCALFPFGTILGVWTLLVLTTMRQKPNEQRPEPTITAVTS